MRCPKCGYISFDRQKSCGKCGNDLLSIAEQLRGTTLRGAIPFFLGGLMAAPTAATASAEAFQEAPDVLGLEPLMVDESFAEADLDAIEEQEMPPDTELDLGSLDSIEEPPPAEIELDLDLAGAPLEEEQERAPLPPLGLDEIDVSDLLPPMPPEEEAEEMGLELSLDAEEEPLPPPAEQETAQPSQEIELPPLQETDIDLISLEESPSPPTSASHTEDDDIVDLSLFMEPETTAAPNAGPTETPVDLDLSLDEDADQPLSLSLEDDEETAAVAESAAPSASGLDDIPDLGLTLEMEDENT